MATIRGLKWQYSGTELDEKLEEARYNYAAALDLTTRGETVSSNSVAGGMARVAGANFAGYCASGPSSDAPNSTADAYESMFGHRKVTGKCPCCNELTTYDPCDPKCTVCGSDSKTNRAAEYFAKRRADKKKITEQKTHKQAKSEKHLRIGAEALDNIKGFIWGDSAFAGVEQAIDYYGHIIAVGRDAKELYNLKYNLN
jgi:hypothetical protein